MFFKLYSREYLFSQNSKNEKMRRKETESNITCTTKASYFLITYAHFHHKGCLYKIKNFLLNHYKAPVSLKAVNFKEYYKKEKEK